MIFTLDKPMGPSRRLIWAESDDLKLFCVATIFTSTPTRRLSGSNHTAETL